jgi:predicted alpha/beta hydrolase
MAAIPRHRLIVTAPDGARAAVQLHAAEQPRRALYWLPALGVGIGPNERFADAVASRAAVVAVHEWRGLGSSDRRATRDCDWGYRTLFEDIAAGLAAARAQHPDLRWHLGGHSLGGQIALILAALAPGDAEGVFLVASGHPHWREFPGLQAPGVYSFAAAIPLLVAVAGHFPGSRLGFAGREAGRLMREWAVTARRGDYRIADFGDAIDQALAAYEGPVRALRLSEDKLAPPGAIERLRGLSPRAQWRIDTVTREQLRERRADHFGWLREPQVAADAFADWAGSRSGL